jgi:hypothetical protein
MNSQDQATTGINKLTPLEKAALEQWVKQWEEEEAKNPTTPPSQDQAAKETISLAQEAPSPSDATPNPQDAPQIPEVALSPGTCPAAAPAPTPQAAPKPVTANSAIQSVLNEGKYIIIENGTTYIVPTPLRKKCANWKQGDLLRIDETKKASWFRITNIMTNEWVLVKVEEVPELLEKPETPPVEKKAETPLPEKKSDTPPLETK